jgi:uncharacterized CHY-type Zn-finger protein
MLRLVLFMMLVPFGLLANLAHAQATSDRIKTLELYHGYYPCMDCHADQEPVVTPRILEEDHYEPLAWEDDEGEVHLVPYGRHLAISDLLGQTNGDGWGAEDLVRIGARINITRHMEFNGLSPEDSVWTLVHGGGNLWCLDCHDTKDRDKLIRLDGELLTFNQSQLLCGGCHGSILRDWDAGIHGTTVGFWDLSRDTAGQSLRRLCVECHSPHDPAFRPLAPMPGPVARVAGPGPAAASEHSEEAH